MDRLPEQDDRLVRNRDEKAFRVAHVTHINGGELHFALVGDDGERVSLCAEGLFPPLREAQPYRFA